jgi:pyridoxine 5-phosphate synthase
LSTALSVNLNKVALLRNQRDLTYPSITRAARTCIDAGADGITVHPRPDERHVRRTDVYDLADMLTVEFNIEGNPETEFMSLVEAVRPAQCTLVPDSPDQKTSDHGWDLSRDAKRLGPIVARLKRLGIRVSIFMDPDPEAMLVAAELGVDRIELYTEPYATAFGTARQEAVLDTYVRTGEAAVKAGLGINAGHDLTSINLAPFIATMPSVKEVSIGHALIADALWDGFAATVRRYKAAIG